MKLKSPEQYGYVVKNGICLFQKGPLSQWWGGFAGQSGSFIPPGSDHVFNCSEQFMMATKASIMNDFETADKILAEKNPSKHKDLGRQIKNFDSALWDKLKFSTVYLGNYYKFTQNGDLQDFILMLPDNIVFAEAAPWDKIWGIGLDLDDPRALNQDTWQGTNLLGEAITAVHRVLTRQLDHIEYLHELRHKRN